MPFKEAGMLATTILSLTLMGQVILPGSNLGVPEATEEAHLVVVAEIIGIQDGLGVGALSLLSGVELKPSAILKGKVMDGDLNDLTVGASGNERCPEKGDVSIFFILRDKGHGRILKMLPKTEENLAAIKARNG